MDQNLTNWLIIFCFMQLLLNLFLSLFIAFKSYSICSQKSRSLGDYGLYSKTFFMFSQEKSLSCFKKNIWVKFWLLQFKIITCSINFQFPFCNISKFLFHLMIFHTSKRFDKHSWWNWFCKLTQKLSYCSEPSKKQYMF